MGLQSKWDVERFTSKQTISGGRTLHSTLIQYGAETNNVGAIQTKLYKSSRNRVQVAEIRDAYQCRNQKFRVYLKIRQDANGGLLFEICKGDFSRELVLGPFELKLNNQGFQGNCHVKYGELESNRDSSLIIEFQSNLDGQLQMASFTHNHVEPGIDLSYKLIVQCAADSGLHVRIETAESRKGMKGERKWYYNSAGHPKEATPDAKPLLLLNQGSAKAIVNNPVNLFFKGCRVTKDMTMKMNDDDDYDDDE